MYTEPQKDEREKKSIRGISTHSRHCYISRIFKTGKKNCDEKNRLLEFSIKFKGAFKKMLVLVDAKFNWNFRKKVLENELVGLFIKTKL